MGSKAPWLMILVFVICFNCKCNEASNSNLSREEESEIEAQLKLLNKPFIKTFKNKVGDIIDCVDINKQPALHHPLLKNHKVQARPSAYLSNLFKDDSSQSNYDLLTSNNNKEYSCPDGFVPIRRTLKKDLIRLRSLSSSNKQESGPQSSINPNGDDDDYFLDSVKFPYDQNVVSYSLMKGNKYYGTNVYMSIYNVSLGDDQLSSSSSSNIWVVSGPTESLDVLLAGWQVNPTINGDSRTRMFLYWTADGGAKTGCYNMLCQGFVQVHPSIFPGFVIDPSSTYRGQIYEYQFTIIQQSGNWWVLLGEKQEGLGYWPNELFEKLSNGADQIAWGGIAKPLTDGFSPPLGSGHMPNGQYNEASFFRSIRYIVDGFQMKSPEVDNTISFVSNTDCYDLNANQNCGHDELRYCFSFGGPGGYDCQTVIA